MKCGTVMCFMAIKGIAKQYSVLKNVIRILNKSTILYAHSACVRCNILYLMTTKLKKKIILCENLSEYANVAYIFKIFFK